MRPKSQKRMQNPVESFEGSVKFVILFLRLWTHLDAFPFLRSLLGGFGQSPFFAEYQSQLTHADKNTEAPD